MAVSFLLCVCVCNPLNVKCTVRLIDQRRRLVRAGWGRGCWVGGCCSGMWCVRDTYENEGKISTVTFFFFFSRGEINSRKRSARLGETKFRAVCNEIYSKRIRWGNDNCCISWIRKILKNHVVVIQITLKAQCVKVKNYVAMYVFTKLWAKIST